MLRRRIEKRDISLIHVNSLSTSTDIPQDDGVLNEGMRKSKSVKIEEIKKRLF